MATKTKSETKDNRPTHRVVFRPKTRNGYGQAVTLGGAWENSVHGVSFPFAGGQVTVWPVDRKNEGDA